MLATTDNTRGQPRVAAEVMSAKEAAKWFTRPGLAVALKVAVSTIDRMVKSEELPCVRLRGRVRFYLPDVIEALRKGDRKFGRAAELTAKSAKSTELRNHLTQPSPQSGEGAATERRNGGAS